MVRATHGHGDGRDEAVPLAALARHFTRSGMSRLHGLSRKQERRQSVIPSIRTSNRRRWRRFGDFFGGVMVTENVSVRSRVWRIDRGRAGGRHTAAAHSRRSGGDRWIRGHPTRSGLYRAGREQRSDWASGVSWFSHSHSVPEGRNGSGDGRTKHPLQGRVPGA